MQRLYSQLYRYSDPHTLESTIVSAKEACFSGGVGLSLSSPLAGSFLDKALVLVGGEPSCLSALQRHVVNECEVCVCWLAAAAALRAHACTFTRHWLAGRRCWGPEGSQGF